MCRSLAAECTMARSPTSHRHGSTLSLMRFQRLLRSGWQSLLSSRELRRLRRHHHPQAQRLAAVLVDWRRRCPIDDPLITSIERQRAAWLREDGTPTGRAFADKHSVARACRASLPAYWAELLYRIARDSAPKVLLELGTNLGISSAYLAAGGRTHGSSVVTLEGSPARVALAQSLHRALNLRGISYRVGKFRETLTPLLEERLPIEFAFIDGHHQRTATLDYFDEVHPHLTDDAVVVFDDIRWSEEMYDAWRILCEDKRFALMVDLVKLGIGITQRQPSDTVPQVFRMAGAIRAS